MDQRGSRCARPQRAFWPAPALDRIRNPAHPGPKPTFSTMARRASIEIFDTLCRSNRFCVPDIVRIPSPVIATVPDPAKLPYNGHIGGNPARLRSKNDVLLVRCIRRSQDGPPWQDPSRPPAAAACFRQDVRYCHL